MTDGFLNTKADKRLIKHSTLISKIEKSAVASGQKKKSLKRRRPNKKLVATLESLGDALDDIVAQGGMGGQEDDDAQLRAGKVRHKSLKSKPGALKKKERIVRGEMERFGRSLAQLVAVSGGGGDGGSGSSTQGRGEGIEVERTEEEEARTESQTQTQSQIQSQSTTTQPQPQSSTANRWAALRGFISLTMEQNPAFVGKG